MSVQLEVLRLVAARLHAIGVPFMVTGSIASSHYATPRFTRDIDVVVEIDDASARRIAAAFQEDFFLDEPALHRAVSRKGMTNMIHMELLVKVDLIVRKDTPYRREEFGRRRVVGVDGVTVWFVAPEDLLLSKLVWMQASGSEVQRRDIVDLISSVPDLDRDHIGRWAPELGVEALWKELSHGG